MAQPNDGDMTAPVLSSVSSSVADVEVSNSRGRRALWILGVVILVAALVGPTGLLWDLFDVESTEDASPFENFHHTPNHQRSRTGDSRHELPHPPTMLRSDKATGSLKHKKFGSFHKRKRGKHDRRHDRDKSFGIKESIAQMFDINAPPPVESKSDSGDGDDHKSTRDNPKADPTESGQRIASRQPDDEAHLLPVVHADDDVLPLNAENMNYLMPASDALECRSSVIAFVINATDVKDECDGLRKAFDKTCSAHHSSDVDVTQGRPHEHLGGRSLRQWGAPRFTWPGEHWPNLCNVGWRIKRALRIWRASIQSHFAGDDDDTFFFAEDRVASADVWQEATELVERNLYLELVDEMRNTQAYSPAKLKDLMVIGLEQNKTHDYSWEDIPNISRKLHTHAAQSDARAPEPNHNNHVNAEQRKTEESLPQNLTAATEPPLQPPPPVLSLMIPTSEKHIGDQKLNDALLLQDTSTNENIAQRIQNAANVTHDDSSDNIPQSSVEAARDASESAEAIRTATEAVNNVLNDPKSVEARTCCASILSVFHEHCDPTTTGEEQLSDRRLLVIVFVITVCGMVKSIIRFFNIRWLPEAGGCILVGVMGYLILQNMPHVQFAFDGDMFLRIMVPPIVFEAAVKINKRSFQRHIVPITIYAIVGTLVSTALTAFLLHMGTAQISWCETIPIKESLIFGSLISSIDPIAVLSVLNNMGMTDSDTIYVLIFGESLLNDGVAIVLFQTLVHFLDESLVIDGDALRDATIHFVVVALGSLTVGVLSGACATIYFSIMHGCHTPMVEVIMFSCWAFIPYYICDGVEWSGIVAVVANGFVMDLYVVGQKPQVSTVDDEIDFLVNGSSNNFEAKCTRMDRRRCSSIFNYEGHLSAKADSHVHFFIEIFATLMETAIFAYLGLFLFSPRYHWNAWLTAMSIFACVTSRIIMIPALSHAANLLNKLNTSRNRNSEGVHIDRRMQTVLVFAGLRGAMSFALVEHIPLFDTINGQGSRWKPELKAMTSASIVFTVFVLGGATSYLMERIGYSLNKEHDTVEMSSLLTQHDNKGSPNSDIVKRNGLYSSNGREHVRNIQPMNTTVRQRVREHGT